jgi:hypothetical protein
LTLPKLKAAGLKLTNVPAPVNVIFWGLVGALSLIVNVPVLVLICVGLNTTSIVQLDPIDRVEPQPFERVKSPLMETLPMFRVDVP